MTNDMKDIDVTETVFHQYVRVQRSGSFNMVTERAAVQRYALENGFEELAGFIESGEYFDIIDNYSALREAYGSPAE